MTTTTDGEITFRAEVSQEEEDAMLIVPQELKERIADNKATLKQMEEKASSFSLKDFRL
jgi:hypothetical protein